MKLQKIKIANLKQGLIRQEILPDGFIERVRDYKHKLAEVEHSNLEQAVSNFQRDEDPEKELGIWEKIAFAYETFALRHTGISPDAKKEAFVILLGASMGDRARIEQVKHLTISQAEDIVNILLDQ